MDRGRPQHTSAPALTPEGEKNFSLGGVMPMRYDRCVMQRSPIQNLPGHSTPNSNSVEHLFHDEEWQFGGDG